MKLSKILIFFSHFMYLLFKYTSTESFYLIYKIDIQDTWF